MNRALSLGSQKKVEIRKHRFDALGNGMLIDIGIGFFFMAWLAMFEYDMMRKSIKLLNLQS